MQAMASEESDDKYDSFGFLRVNVNDQSEDADFRCHDYSAERSNDHVYTPKWQALFADWDHATKEDSERVALLIQEHVPNNLRGQLWGKLLEIRNAKASVKLDYDKRVREITQLEEIRAVSQAARDDQCRAYARNYKLGESNEARPSELTEDGKIPAVKAVRQIRLDLDRTFYTHRMFMKHGEGQQKLFNILAVYASYNPEVGYCQGMAYVAAVLLMHMPEEDAFWALYCLMESPKYFHDFYSQSLTRVQHEALVFAGLIAGRMPALSEHMESMCIHPLMYVTQWFMCGFTSLPLWDTVLAIWDTFMLKGVASFHRVGLSILDICNDEMMAAKNIADVLPYLHHLPPNKMSRGVVMSTFWSMDEAEVEAQRKSVSIAVRDGVDPASLKPPFWKAQQAAERRDRRGHVLQEQNSNMVPATPTLFKRMIAVLSTPLRVKAQARRTEMLHRSTQDVCTPVASPHLAARTEDSPTPTATPMANNQAKRMLQRHQLGTVGSPALRAPLPDSPMTAPASPLAMLSPEAVMAAQEAFSPSFARSGILSPSFRNMSSILSPRDQYDAPLLLHSPSEHSAVIETASPGTRASFAAFSMVTPLRQSQVLRKNDDGSVSHPLNPRGGRINPASVPLAPLHKSPAPSAVLELLDVTPLRPTRRGGTQSARPMRKAQASGHEIVAPASVAIVRQKRAVPRPQRSITPLKAHNDNGF